MTANGLVFLDCTLSPGRDQNAATSDGSSATTSSLYLGRPWGWYLADQMPSTIFIRTRMGPHIRGSGWDPWEQTGVAGADRDPRTRYSEFASTDLYGRALNDADGNGTPDTRVSWADPITAAQAANYRSNLRTRRVLDFTYAAGNERRAISRRTPCVESGCSASVFAFSAPSGRACVESFHSRAEAGWRPQHDSRLHHRWRRTEAVDGESARAVAQTSWRNRRASGSDVDLHDRQGVWVATNQNWKDSQQAALRRHVWRLLTITKRRSSRISRTALTQQSYKAPEVRRASRSPNL